MSYFPKVFCYSNSKNLVKDGEYNVIRSLHLEEKDPLKPRRESHFVASDNREDLLYWLLMSA